MSSGAISPLEGAGDRESDLLKARLNVLLPDNYSEVYERVEPVPMRSAPLQYREGKVVWNEIWASFCDLAMAGGPAHRGRLLEPGSSEEIKHNRELYRETVEEICRGVHLVTGLYAEASLADGWVQTYCTSAAMADWLARAVTMENVSACRRGLVLYLPAAPGFRVEKEIKNVVTVMAKTTHYWVDHTGEGRKAAIAQLFRNLDAELSLVQPALVQQAGDRCAYEQLRDSLEKSITTKTGLTTASDTYPRWIGFNCSGIPLAITIMRNLVVQNVLARREGTAVFVPVNPDPAGNREVVVECFARAWRCALREVPADRQRAPGEAAG